MKSSWKFILIKLTIITGLVLLSYYSLSRFLTSKELYGWYSFEINFDRMLTIFSLSALFISLMFLIDINIYRKVFWTLVIITLGGGIIIHSFNLAEIRITSRDFWNIWEFLVLLTYSMIGPGLILYTLHYMLKNTEKYENVRIFGDYHIHEGFVGVIFIILALLFIPLRTYMFDETIFLNELVFLLGTVQILMFSFLFFGNFLIIRDWKDVFHLRFIEKKKKREISTQNQEDTSLFSLIKKEDVEFFTITKIILYPLGIIMMSLSINAIVFGSSFLPKEIFNLEHQEVMYLGFVLSFIAGGFIGRDWCRLFKRFYPELYTELELALNKLKNS